MRPLLTIALALALVGCSHAPLATVSRTLSVGETYDGVHGLCKWVDHRSIVWGRPHAESPSPYGMGQSVYIDSLPVRTEDGALIVEAHAAKTPGHGCVKIVFTVRGGDGYLVSPGPSLSRDF